MRASRSVDVRAVAVERSPRTARCGPRTTPQGAVVPLIFLEFKLDWKAAVDDVLVAVVGLWALLRSGGIVVVLLQRSSALERAVAAAAEGPVSSMCTASALQNHPDTIFFLDPEAASQLQKKTG